jgi:hypothetical protein
MQNSVVFYGVDYARPRAETAQSSAEATLKTRMFLRAQEVGGVHCYGLGGYHCVAAPAYRIRGSFLTTADGRRLLNAV